MDQNDSYGHGVNETRSLTVLWIRVIWRETPNLHGMKLFFIFEVEHLWSRKLKDNGCRRKAMAVGYLIPWGFRARFPLFLLDKRICTQGTFLPLALPPNTFTLPSFGALCLHKETSESHNSTNRCVRNSCDSDTEFWGGLRAAGTQPPREPAPSSSASAQSWTCLHWFGLFFLSGWV